MLRYSSSVVINKPAETIFPYLAEPERQAMWSDVPMRRLDGREGPFVTGSRMELTMGSGPMKAKIGLEVTLEAPRRMAFKWFSGPVKWDGEYTLDQEGDGTRVSQRGTLTFTGLWRLMEPMAGAEIKNGEIKELQRLKAVVEQD